MGRYIVRSHIAGDYFVPIGDSHLHTFVDRPLVYQYGKRINDPQMQALAVANWDDQVLAKMLKSYSLDRLLLALFTYEELAKKSQPAPLLQDVWLDDKDLEMMAARDEEGTATGLYVAAWGAHNNQSHNHNDVGNFIIYLDGQPYIVDVGVPGYTKQTFSPQRYEIWAMRSAYHNLPIVNGIEQKAGSQFCAQEVAYAWDEKTAQLRMDIAPSYPKEAGLDPLGPYGSADSSSMCRSDRYCSFSRERE